MKTKSAKFKVFDTTKGTMKCHEVDSAGEKTTEMVGQLYVQKGAFGDALKVGTEFLVTIQVD